MVALDEDVGSYLVVERTLVLNEGVSSRRKRSMVAVANCSGLFLVGF